MKTDSPLLETNDGFLVCQPETEINQPSGSVYLMDIFDKDLLKQIDTQLMDSQVFIPINRGITLLLSILIFKS